MRWRNGDEYSRFLDAQVKKPAGFHFFRTGLTFSAMERSGDDSSAMNLAYIHSETNETSAALVTTTNRFPGAPVILGRERIRDPRLRGILVNNKVANVGVANGVADARGVAASAAEAFSVPESRVLSVSTGVIGWRLPRREIEDAIPRLHEGSCSPREFAEAIMTTDRYPKAVSSEPLGATDGDGPVILGMAKGAGMVEPNLATMLAFFVTDALVTPEVLDRVLRRVVDRSFNCLSVDGDQSTSDMVIAMAGGMSGVELDEAELERRWQPVADTLALEIVRNGEGTAHVIEVIIRGSPDRRVAQALGKHVVNSPLVKTAIHGNDPNVGRILGALGDGLSRYDRERTLDPSRLTITLADREVYRDGAFRLDATTERALADLFSSVEMDPSRTGFPQDKGTVPIVIDFHEPAREDVRVFGSDLSYEYIRVNADYRT